MVRTFVSRPAGRRGPGLSPVEGGEANRPSVRVTSRASIHDDPRYERYAKQRTRDGYGPPDVAPPGCWIVRPYTALRVIQPRALARPPPRLLALLIASPSVQNPLPDCGGSVALLAVVVLPFACSPDWVGARQTGATTKITGEVSRTQNNRLFPITF